MSTLFVKLQNNVLDGTSQSPVPCYIKESVKQFHVRYDNIFAVLQEALVTISRLERRGEKVRGGNQTISKMLGEEQKKKIWMGQKKKKEQKKKEK